MTSSLQQAFDQSVEAIARGERLEQVLKRFPQHADELRSLLMVVERTKKLSADQPDQAAQMRSRTAMLARAHELTSSPPARSPLALIRWGLAATLVTLFLIVASGFGLAVASAQALPGDDLYTVKRAAERIQLNFTAGQTNRLNLAIHQDTQRIHEVQRLLALGRVVEVEFEAELDSKSGSLWQFGNVPVLVTTDTVVPSGLRVGDVIQIRGRTTAQGWVRAHSLSAAGLTFDGRIETAKSTQWIIASRAITILPSSILDPDLQPGDLVRVWARTEGEFLVAQQILEIGPAATPVPTIAPSNAVPSTTAEPTVEDDDDDLVEFDISGRLEAKEDWRWQIDDRWIHLDQDTELEGDFQPGTIVRAKGEVQPDGRYLADEIRQLEDQENDSDGDSDEQETPEAEGDSTAEPEDDDDDDDEADDEPTSTSTNSSDDDDDDDDDNEDDSVEVDIKGEVQSIENGQWVVADQTIIITADTRIEDDLEVGDTAQVDAEKARDGTLYAEKIERAD